GEAVTVTFSVTSTAGTPSGNVTVTASGGGESCTGSVAEGRCDIVLTQTGDRNLTATYQGDQAFASSSSPSILHHVNEPAPPSNFPPVATDDNYLVARGPFTVPGPAG